MFVRCSAPQLQLEITSLSLPFPTPAFTWFYCTNYWFTVVFSATRWNVSTMDNFSRACYNGILHFCFVLEMVTMVTLIINVMFLKVSEVTVGM